jgi:hypothetical protein
MAPPIRTSVEKTSLRYGIFTALACIGYFLLLKVLGLLDQIAYSFLLGIILTVGVCLAIAYYKRTNENRIAYLTGVGVGFVTGFVTSVLFGLFFVVYSTIDPTFVEAMRTRNLFGLDFSITAVFFLAIVMQGVMIGAFIGYIAMQYFKNPDHKPLRGIE